MRRRTGSWLACALLIAAGCTDDGGSGSDTTAAPETVEETTPDATEPATETTRPPETDPPPTEQPTTTAAATATTAPPDTTTTTTDPPAANPTFDALPAVVEGDPDLRTGVLANGLTYFIRDNDNPGGSAELRLVVDAGSAAETADQSGVAHFLEHMLFNGTASFPKNELISILRSSGSQFGSDVNAYTSYDETVYRLTLPTTGGGERLEIGLDVLAEWLSAATLDPAEVVAERGVVLDEWRSRGETSDGRIRTALQDMFLGGSEFHARPPIGTSESIERMTPELLRAFYDAEYRPDNAAVVVIGDIDVDDVLAGVEARFGALQPRPGAPAAPLTLTPSAAPVAGRVADPDLTDRAIELTLPKLSEGRSVAASPGQVADALIFTMIATRLSDDATRGDEPFDRAYVSTNQIVRVLDAPSIVVEPKLGESGAAMLVLLDEFERAHRFGFDAAELQRAVAGLRAGIEAEFAGRDTRQDADFADLYAQTFLLGSPILTSQADYELSTFLLDHMTPEYVTARFEHRWDTAAPHLMVYGPESEADELPTIEAIDAAIAALPERDITARPAGEVLDGELMQPPAPVTEVSSGPGPEQPEVFLDPIQLEFANGVTVVLNATPIVDNQVTVSAESNGGIAYAAPEDIAEAQVAAEVVSTSGVGAFDQAQLDQLLAGSTAAVSPHIGASSDQLFGSAATTDLEDLFQLIHLYMVDPNFDAVALDRVLDEARAEAADPFADQSSAGLAELTRLRFGDDPRFRSTLTTADVDSIDLASIERVWRRGFGNASGWTFAIVGDLDIAAVTELARQYFGTLVSTGPGEAPLEITPEPPAGVVGSDIAAGTGDKATVFRLYSTRLPATVENTVLADIATEVLSNRLLDRLREELGESYSPIAAIQITPAEDGGDDFVDIYLEAGSAPEQVEAVVATLSEEIADLTGGGPTDDEIEAAIAVIEEEYNYVNNERLCAVLLGSLTGIGESAAEYVDAYFTLADIGSNDVRAYFRAVVPADRYVEVGVVPR